MKETTRDKRNVKRVVYRLKQALKNLDVAVVVAGQVSHLLDKDVDARIRDSRLDTIAALLLIKELMR